MLNLNHKRLDVWEMGVSFVGIIYELTKDFPKSESYGITNQLKGSVLAFKHLQSSVIWLHSYICKEIKDFLNVNLSKRIEYINVNSEWVTRCKRTML